MHKKSAKMSGKFKILAISWPNQEVRPLALLGLLWFTWLTLPYIFAWLWGQLHGWQFMGFLFNPQDGLSYLIKIAQGHQGAWCYTSPFDPDAVCQPIFLYYLALGHFARGLGWSIPWMYQVARGVNGLFLFFVLVIGLRRHFTRAARPLALGLVLFGAGLGWLALPWTLPALPPDFNLADAFPYLNAIGMPHFLLTHALVFLYWFWGFPRLWTLEKGPGWVVALVAVTSVISPFAALLMAGTPFVAQVLRGRWRPRRTWLLVLLAALAYPLGLSWVLHRAPSWRAWTEQNVMLSPPPGLLILALMPALGWALYAFLAAPGLDSAQQTDLLTVLRAWLLLALALGYWPGLALQRRFLVAVYADVALAAALGWRAWAVRHPRWAARARSTLVIASLPTLGLNLIGYAWAMQAQPATFYLAPSEVAALEWLRDRELRALWLAHPETSMRLAAFADQRALVGHPIETPAYADKARLVRAWLCHSSRPPAWQDATSPTWIWFGPRERAWCRAARARPLGGVCFQFREEVCLYEEGRVRSSTRGVERGPCPSSPAGAVGGGVRRGPDGHRDPGDDRQ